VEGRRDAGLDRARIWVSAHGVSNYLNPEFESECPFQTQTPHSFDHTNLESNRKSNNCYIAWHFHKKFLKTQKFAQCKVFWKFWDVTPSGRRVDPSPAAPSPSFLRCLLPSLLPHARERRRAGAVAAGARANCPSPPFFLLTEAAVGRRG
jgi:hypothetical protein